MADAVYGGSFPGGSQNTGLELTTAWGVNAAYEHFWNPRWRTSLYGGYAKVEYSGLANSLLCGFGDCLTPASHQRLRKNWQTWWVGSRTQWNVTKDFYMGVDVLYSKMQSANFGNFCAGENVACAAQNSTTNALVIPAKDTDNWAFRFRAHRDFYP